MIDRKNAQQMAEALVDKMTVDEMIGQLKFDAPAIERLHVPAYNWWNEGLHGVARAGTATVFPQAIGMAAAWNPEMMKEVGNAISDEARAKYNESIKHEDRDIYKGLTLWSPNVNIFRDPRWGRGHETYGEDPVLTSRLAVAFIEGMQGTGSYLKTAACAKHFAVHSGPEALRHSFNAVATKKDMYETYLPAFEACVKEAKVEAVMGAYNRTNGEPCCASEELIGEILREKWKFQGHYVSDCWAIRDFHDHHHVTSSGVESSALALNRGCDLNCGCTYLCLKEAFNKHLVKKETIKKAAVRLFTTRFLLGMFEKTEYDKIPYTCVESREHLELCEKAAQESIVLLKNNGVLPLNKREVKTIGVIGPNANNRSSLDGNYHGTASRYVTILEGIQDYVGNEVRILYSQGSHLYLDKEEQLAQKDDRISEALSVTEYCDVVILCVGLDESLEGEEGDTGNAYASGDKKDLEFPQGQKRLMDAVLNTDTPVIVCNFTGSAMKLSLADEKAAAVIQAWYPGAQGGAALAKILFGEVSPSGKLPVTFYQSLDTLPAFEDYSMRGRTYRYLEEKPLYPFGYGLTYGEARVIKTEFVKQPKRTEDLIIQVMVENVSVRTIRDVVQVYIQNNDSSFAPPNPVLCGFAKSDFVARKKTEVTITIPKAAFQVVNQQGEKIWDSSSSTLFIGMGGVDERSQELTGQPVKKMQIVW
ncbi:MAG: glycoside hydrolase family 3 C-terminal domain-containing protein [Mediterraneibacter gnavus]